MLEVESDGEPKRIKGHNHHGGQPQFYPDPEGWVQQPIPGWGPPPPQHPGWGPPPAHNPGWGPPQHEDWIPKPDGSYHKPKSTTTSTTTPTTTTTSTSTTTRPTPAPVPGTCNCKSLMSCVCHKLLGDVTMEDLYTVAQTPDQKHLCSFIKKHKCGASLATGHSYTPRSSRKKMSFCKALKNFYNFVSV